MAEPVCVCARERAIFGRIGRARINKNEKQLLATM